MIDDSGYDIRLEVDGGVKDNNIKEIKEAGADMFVAGSAIFGAADNNDTNDYETIIGKFRDQLAAGQYLKRHPPPFMRFLK